MLRQITDSLLCAMMVVLLVSKVDAQSDSSKFREPSFFGYDFFLSGEIYGIRLLDNAADLTTGGGLGVEFRIYPFFLGAMIGNCGDEGLPNLHPAGTFSFYSLYGGTIIKNYRIEIGEIIANNGSWTTNSPSDYTVAFLGISRRWGDIFFFEPEAKLVFPIEAIGYRDIWIPVNEHYHLQDLFFGFGIKIGVGIN